MVIFWKNAVHVLNGRSFNDLFFFKKKIVIICSLYAKKKKLQKNCAPNFQIVIYRSNIYNLFLCFMKKQKKPTELLIVTQI